MRRDACRVRDVMGTGKTGRLATEVKLNSKSRCMFWPSASASGSHKKCTVGMLLLKYVADMDKFFDVRRYLVGTKQTVKGELVLVPVPCFLHDSLRRAVQKPLIPPTRDSGSGCRPVSEMLDCQYFRGGGSSEQKKGPPSTATEDGEGVGEEGKKEE